MERDLFLISEILEAVARAPERYAELSVEALSYESESGEKWAPEEDELRLHCDLLVDAGYAAKPPEGDAGVLRLALTWEGYDFLDAVRDAWDDDDEEDEDDWDENDEDDDDD